MNCQSGRPLTLARFVRCLPACLRGGAQVLSASPGLVAMVPYFFPITPVVEELMGGNKPVRITPYGARGNGRSLILAVCALVRPGSGDDGRLHAGHAVLHRRRHRRLPCQLQSRVCHGQDW